MVPELVEYTVIHQRSPNRTTPLLEKAALQHSMSKEAGEVVGYPKRMKTFLLYALVRRRALHSDEKGV